MHTELCQKQKHINTIYRDLWTSEYPNYCRTCEGRDHVRRAEPLPITNNWAAANLMDCPDCIGKGKCARCGAMLIPSRDGPNRDVSCIECGWNWCRTSGDAMPQLHECFCGNETPTARLAVENDTVGVGEKAFGA